MSFAEGDTVRVDDRPHEGHHRTPDYLKGRIGTVERVHGMFLNPETRAYDSEGKPTRQLYLVGFDLPDLWPDYGGKPEDQLLADVFEHWLEDAS
jgi:nitrile hydratase subunit beta